MLADMHWVGQFRMQTMQPVQNGSLTSPSQVSAGNPMNLGLTGVGRDGYCWVTGLRKPVNVDAKVSIIPFTLSSTIRYPYFLRCPAVGYRTVALQTEESGIAKRSYTVPARRFSAFGWQWASG